MIPKRRDWRTHWTSVQPLITGELDEALAQVGKTLLGEPVAHDQVDLMIETIRDSLELGPRDNVIDLGCGNGLMTERIAASVDHVIGVDVSQVLIDDARRYRMPDNVTYWIGDLSDVVALRRLIGSGAKIVAYEVLQHLTHEELAEMLRDLRQSTLFLGSIPNRDQLHAFYNTPQRWRLYEESSREGTEQIGTWWSPDELAEICTTLGFECTLLDQPADLYTAHYRFDALLRPRC